MKFDWEKMRVGDAMCGASAVILTSLFLLSCDSAKTTQPGDSLAPPSSLNDGLKTARPGDVNLDESILVSLVNRIRTHAIRNQHSLLMARHDRLVLEEYFNGSSREDIHTQQSVSKSVTSLLIAAVMQRDYIRSVDETVVSFFPEYRDLQNLDSRKTGMTLRHVLTMQTGLDWSEGTYNTSPLKQLNDCHCDWLRFVLDWPMRETPGTRFEYNSGGVILLGGIIRHATEIAVDQFAEQVLFAPLGISGAWWHYGQPNALPHMGGGLNLSARDMAKIGLLVLHQGRWGDEQVIAEQWLAKSTQRAAMPGYWKSHPVYYGYLWWLLPLSGRAGQPESDGDMITAAGAGGQWIFVVPKHDLVVVVTGAGYDGDDWLQPVDFLYADILRAVE